MSDSAPTSTTDTTEARPRRPRSRRTKIVVAGAVLAVGALAAGGVATATGDRGGDDAPLTGAVLDDASKVAVAEAGGGRVTEASTDDDGGTVAYELEVTKDDGTQVDVDLDRDLGVVRTDVDGRDDRDDDRDERDDDRDGRDGRDDDAPLTGDVLAKASAAALAEAGGGTVTDSSIDDDRGAAYEVEVTLDDGTEVDVHLDEAFAVVRTDTDRPDRDD